MPAIISMLRGVNLGPHNRISMEALRALYGSLKLKSAKTLLQSGNVVFLSDQKNLGGLSQRIQEAIERNFGFRSEVILRTSAQMRHVIARNPFASRHGIEPAKLLVVFLSRDPGNIAREAVKKIDTRGEELHAQGSELYVYFPNGIGQSKIPWKTIDKTMDAVSTGRNWSTVVKLLELAESLEKSE